MAKAEVFTGITLNELYEMCKAQVEAGYGDRIVTEPHIRTEEEV